MSGRAKWWAARRREMGKALRAKQMVWSIYAVWTYSESPEQLNAVGELLGVDFADPYVDRDFWMGEAFDRIWDDPAMLQVAQDIPDLISEMEEARGI